MPFMLSAFFALTICLAPLTAAADQWPYRDQLRTEIRFWIDIFTKYGDDSFVLHDPEDLALVYKTITYGPDESDFRREQRLTAARYEVEHALRSLADALAGGRELTGQEKQLRKLFGPSAAPQRVKLCASRIRAQRGIANRFHQGMQRSTAYIPAIKKIFRNKGLPESLAYLPHVESSFDITARSKAGAAGMWQFMKPTARTFSLKMNAIIDERYDPLVASEAAAALLKMNYDELGDWGLALTAYNYGLGGMALAAERCGGNYMNVRRKYQHPRFQFASKNFYPEFLAVMEIMENPAAYFPGYSPASRHHIVQHRVKKPSTLPVLAKNWGLKLSRLRELNPGYSKKAWAGRLTIPAGYSINIPTGFVALQMQPAPAGEKSFARVPPGKSLGATVASKEAAPVSALVSQQENFVRIEPARGTAIKALPLE